MVPVHQVRLAVLVRGIEGDGAQEFLVDIGTRSIKMSADGCSRSDSGPVVKSWALTAARVVVAFVCGAPLYMYVV